MEAIRNEIVAFHHVSKIYNTGTVALSQFHFSITEGEFISFLGPSGCGKSTALRMVAGLGEATEGKVEVFGQNPKEVIKNTNDVAFVFQDANLLPWRTVLENVMLPLELRGSDKKSRKEDAIKVLEMVGLKDHIKSYPRQLSGGMRMRVSIARALAAKPKLLLMDEPFAALDEITRQTLQTELLEIWKREKMTILFVTHNVFEAVYLSTRIAVLSARPGRLSSIIDVDLPYPRERTDERFTEYVDISSQSLENSSTRRELV
ncbi:ABC transporter ATP-binding protein [Aeribacillus sp. FSL K6-2848]|uniref:Nitrate/sulfonate/bicarbonate ABC transporter ATP-binding protein n=1 Tax=Aeribacillus pallidus TaxID=33936 RepID=A0A161WYT4_9BACI|nr:MULTISPECIES: ABC transporter ATP-binding protein [Aeribacillus]REJ24610.1 MAG: ABC transporter ATP-binding protein [Bacillaceae bacterium]ASS90305.1 nitrate/sulfonate/bicarbonate ABC transporter ATP-binding protein [Aeribacillus pallidus]KZM55209.1 nitrate/sulfonate/bicarbonate ABC transporter ATP-binding protein [Aeribacillus pallidus]MDR9794421.1 ABC transporter ATP-binding protein [Aeribacillus pallidus]MDR9797791.1 ABC transporter ATP-binding protein [Aeribacillus pallidus]